MEALIKRLEKASGPDRLLDDAIANELGLDMPDDPAGWPLRYTASIDAALTLVPNGLSWIVRGPKGVMPSATVFGVITDQIAAHTPAIALCIAALRARGWS